MPFCLKENDTVVRGIEVLNETSSQIILILDEKGRLVGTVTDGDIRRAICMNGRLEGLLDSVCNRQPKTVEGFLPDKVQRIMEEHAISRVPVIDADGFPQGLYCIEDALFKPAPKRINVKVVIMAGGKGTRLWPITKISSTPSMKTAATRLRMTPPWSGSTRMLPAFLITLASPRLIPMAGSRKSTRRVSIQVKMANCFFGFFGSGGNAPGWTNLRLAVRMESSRFMGASQRIVILKFCDRFNLDGSG